MTGLDVITIGRSSVDLYGRQVGGRLEDMASFHKYVGGSPTNMAIGTARLGLRSGLITRVGDEHMGRFIRETLTAEGVDVRGVGTDPERLTALVLLGIRDQDRFPLIFYRENCADMALCEDDIDPAFIAEAGCVTVTGTHLSHPRTEAAVLKALRLARKNGARTALDIDYRPNLWGLAGHDAGDSRYIESAAVTDKLKKNLHLFDLIVGTEEEFHIAGGVTETIAALHAVREVSGAILVCKLGPMGAAAFDGDIPASLDQGLSGPGFPIEVYNVLGAGDGFMSGLLRGWLRDEPWQTTLTYANACGAFAVSRHGCAPSYPSWEDGRQHARVHGPGCGSLPSIIASSLRTWPPMQVRTRRGSPISRRFAWKPPSRWRLAAPGTVSCAMNGLAAMRFMGLRAPASGSGGRWRCRGRGRWLWRLGLIWPLEHVAKVLCFTHPDDPVEMREQQEATILRLAAAARGNGLEFLLEIIPSKVGPVADDTTARVINRIYEIGVRPDWWKLEPMTNEAAWASTCAAIEQNDPWCRGVVVLGLDAPEAALAQSFAAAARHEMVKGFAVGRTIFGEVARDWLRGGLDDAAAVATMAARFRRLCGLWDQARAGKGNAQ
jgi:5-dehydro-2-deoxygluconokinase